MRLRKNSIYVLLVSFTMLFVMMGTVQAGPEEQAKRMHDRLVGVPPSATVLQDMVDELVDNNDHVAAAYIAMENPIFYNTKLKDFATPWTNREQSVYLDLNDSTATVIGMIRDEVPFNQVLYENIVYVGSNNATEVAYSQTDNDHYESLENNGVDLSDTNMLVQRQQTQLPGNTLPASATAGIMTTRGYAQAFLVAGTNRAAVRFATLNFLCLDMEDMRDITARPDFIRQDVTRSPGGDSNIFQTDCLSCHAGLDGLAGAFAYYDFGEEDDNQRIIYTDGAVQAKYLNDAGVFRFGHETLSDNWINYWRVGPNTYIEWRGPGSGSGAKTLGMELASTRQFAECQVRQVFESVCYRPPSGEADHQRLEEIATIFENNNFSMKRVFAETAGYCMGN